MPAFPTSRRQFVRHLLQGGALLGAVQATPSFAWSRTAGPTVLTDGTMAIEFDGDMRSRILSGGRPLTKLGLSEMLRLAGEPGRAGAFSLKEQRREAVSSVHGRGTRHVLIGTSPAGIEKEIGVTFFERYPGAAFLDISFRNIGAAPVAVAGWHAATHDLLAHKDGAWTYSGASHPDRRDWVQEVKPGFQQRNFMGMNGSDYGGGTPVAVVWRRDAGLAVGHLDTLPRLVSLPVASQPGGTRLGIEMDEASLLEPGGTLRLPPLFLMAHEGDYFRPLDAYRRIMADRGLKAPRIPKSSYGAIWCAWGYERNFTSAEIYGTLPKAKALGFEWAVLDDGWQTSEGDWQVDRTKFPRGGADMKAFADKVKSEGLKARLWYAPLAADPGTDLLRDHSDMLLLDASGAAQNVSWWDAYTLCPAYPPTVDYFRGQVRRIIGEWGYDGLKLDGQHLNGVAPCYNPAHKHARPEESFEKLQDFWKSLYDEAIAANPEAVVEICPCGDAFAFHNIPAMNNTPASDPESSWQVRSKGKTFKALMGPSAPYSGDHVELSDAREDFASSYGIGAILSTKFTWPKDTDRPMEKLPPGGFVLTAEKEAKWRRWMDLYQAHRLPEGDYLGGLYDIGFDKPEAHVIAKEGRLHYAFFADRFDGPVPLRGLGRGAYRLSDPYTGRVLGVVRGEAARIALRFEGHQLIVAEPVAKRA